MNRDDFMSFMGILAGVISLLAYIPYISSIIRKKTIPSRTTWWILSLVGIVTLITYKGSGASNTIFFLVGDVTGAFLIALLSIFYGNDGVKFFDRACFFGAIVSFGLWIVFQKNPAIAFFSSLTVEVIAMIPTIRKVHLNPFEEDATAWMFTFLATAVNLYAIERWSFIVAFYPFYEFFINGIIVFLLAMGRSRFALIPKEKPLLRVVQTIKLRT